MRGLIISWFYPPVNASEGLVTYKLLESSGIGHDVFTQRNDLEWSYTSGEKNEFPFINSTPIYFDTTNTNKWIKAGITHYYNNMSKYDFIMTRSMTINSHKVALAIKQRCPSIKWIASFSDPFIQNPFLLLKSDFLDDDYIKAKKCDSILEFLSPVRFMNIFMLMYKRKSHAKYVNETKKLSEDVYAFADALIVTSKWQQKYMFEKYDEIIRKKVWVLPHSFKKDLYKTESLNQNKKLTFTYTGHLDEMRTPMLFLEAVNELKKRIDDLHDSFIVNFYGSIPANCKLYIMDNELSDVIIYKDIIGYIESLEVMQQSDWLLHIDADISKVVEYNIFFAAKLADYMGTGRPIFAVTMDKGTTNEILDSYQNSVVCNMDANNIVNALYSIIIGKIKQPGKVQNGEYDSRVVAGLYDGKVKELVNNNVKGYSYVCSS